MKKQIIILFSVAFLGLALTADKPAYQIFDVKGKKVKYEKMFKDLVEADIIFFGESHNDPIIHWLQFELTRELHEIRSDDLVLGAEMFESDNQLIMDEYFEGLISEKKFEEQARLWNNYKTDYKPIVKYAKENGIRFVATNIPRRYANLVHNEGFEGLEKLSDEAKSYIAPLPVEYDPELPGYKAMMKMGEMGHGGVSENLPKSQAIKDATMSHFILENWVAGKIFLHFNGSYHSNDFEGIVWYIKKSNPELVIKTLSTVQQADLDSLYVKSMNRADYMIVVPETMTRTY